MSNKSQLFTIIYYTSNREDEKFEEKNRQQLLSVCGDIPIISVSQKPIDFGTNICVGDVGACDHNLFRQIQIGCQMAKTPFVISAEADCLYPPDYFQFIPDTKEGYWLFDNLYILNQWGKGEFKGFYKKDMAPFAQISEKEHYIKTVDRYLEGLPRWSSNPQKKLYIPLYADRTYKMVHNKNPILNLKTFNGMRKHTQTYGYPVEDIPYWGNCDVMRKKIWG